MTETDTTAGAATSRPVPTGFDHGDPEVVPHLHETLAELRESCPVGWSENYGGFWTLTRYDDVVTAARDHTHYCTSQGITIPPTGATFRLAPAEYDPPEHTVYRKLEMPFFSQSAVHEAEEVIRCCVRECFDRFPDGDRVDLVEALADPIPPLVLARYLGLDPHRSHELRRLMCEFLSGARASQEEKRVAALALERFVTEQVRDRQATPREDTLSRIVHLEREGERLTDDEVLGMVRLILSAGHETTVHGIGSLCYRVLTEPGLRDRLIAEPDMRRPAVLEALRMDPPVMHMARTVVDDHELRGQQLRKGDKVMVCYGSANRDGEKFPEPDRFDLDRGLRAHVTFGSGRHRCLGEHLAVAELAAVLDEFLERMPDARLVPGTTVEWTGGGITRGVKSLPVVYTRAPR